MEESVRVGVASMKEPSAGISFSELESDLLPASPAIGSPAWNYYATDVPLAHGFVGSS